MCGAEGGGRCCRAWELLLFPKTLLVLGIRVRSFSSSCSQHKFQAVLADRDLLATAGPGLSQEKCEISTKSRAQPAGKGAVLRLLQQQEHASLLGFCFFLHLNLSRKMRR